MKVSSSIMAILSTFQHFIFFHCTLCYRHRLQLADHLLYIKGSTPFLQPPYKANIPLWLALLLKRQRRANIVPPPWLVPSSLTAILELESDHFKQAFSPAPPLPTSSTATVARSPPFIESSIANSSTDALPYHWLELGEILLEAAPDDFEEPDRVKHLMRDLREVRLAKLRDGVNVLDAGGGVKMNGVGGMEVAEGRAFIGGVVDGLRYLTLFMEHFACLRLTKLPRKIGASKEQARREREKEERDNGYDETAEEDDMDV